MHFQFICYQTELDNDKLQLFITNHNVIAISFQFYLLKIHTKNSARSDKMK